jgi:hypothetical protein
MRRTRKKGEEKGGQSPFEKNADCPHFQGTSAVDEILSFSL